MTVAQQHGRTHQITTANRLGETTPVLEGSSNSWCGMVIQSNISNGEKPRDSQQSRLNGHIASCVASSREERFRVQVRNCAPCRYCCEFRSFPACPPERIGIVMKGSTNREFGSGSKEYVECDKRVVSGEVQ